MYVYVCMYVYHPDSRSGFSDVNLFVTIQRVRLSQTVAVVSKT